MKYIYGVYRKYRYYRVCPYCGAHLDPAKNATVGKAVQHE